MIRKIVLWMFGIVGVVIVLIVGATISILTYGYFKSPTVAETIRATTGKHPPTYSLCVNNAMGKDEGVPVEIENACRAAADAGDPLAQWLMGKIAKAHAKDDAARNDEAVHWFELSSQQGSRYAAYNLGTMYFKGDGVGLDYDKAFELFLSSAKQKLPGAQIILADMYAKGKGVQRDDIQALGWLTIAQKNSELNNATKEKIQIERDRLAARMTPEQQARAQEMAAKF